MGRYRISATRGTVLNGAGESITPELVLVDPRLAEAQRQALERKVTMSSTPPSNGTFFIELNGTVPEQAALQVLPEEMARLQVALPLRFEDGQLVVAVADPSNELMIENLRRAAGAEPRLVVTTQAELVRAIGEAYGGLTA